MTSFSNYHYYRQLSLNRYEILSGDLKKRRVVNANEALLRNRGLRPLPDDLKNGTKRSENVA